MLRKESGVGGWEVLRVCMRVVGEEGANLSKVIRETPLSGVFFNQNQHLFCIVVLSISLFVKVF